MFFEVNLKHEILYAMLELNPKKIIFWQKERKTIPKISDEIYYYLKTKNPSLNRKTVQGILYEYRDVGFLKPFDKCKGMGGRNGETVLYDIDQKRLIEFFKKEFESTTIFRIADQYLYTQIID